MRACPHGVVSGQCQSCLAEALEAERQILAWLCEASERREDDRDPRNDYPDQ